MTIEETLKLKAELDKDITKLLAEFIGNTGLYIDGIHILHDHIGTVDGNESYHTIDAVTVVKL